ncbi:hypothetical protein HPB50_003825 [Hyalomma asiaticum]|uniref:Uncharacterized protein n=1 Tax=Hyalomma asiaticum TaxID=266040 RepID=A0ACB7TCJ1_HYAAI|nr:hypothetical protein HPB50_003825 [Hyalomma asiaticum]
MASMVNYGHDILRTAARASNLIDLWREAVSGVWCICALTVETLCARGASQERQPESAAARGGFGGGMDDYTRRIERKNRSFPRAAGLGRPQGLDASPCLQQGPARETHFRNPISHCLRASPRRGVGRKQRMPFAQQRRRQVGK